jgi:hypothetical protein
VLAGLLAGPACAPHEGPAPTVAPSPEATLAAALGIELPPTPGPDPRMAAPQVWVGLDEIAVVRPGLATLRAVEPLTAGGLGAERGWDIEALREAVTPSFAALDSVRPAVELWADRRVPMATVQAVVATLVRAGALDVQLVSGSPDAVGTLLVAPTPVPFEVPTSDAAEPFRADLALIWDVAGVRASALPRLPSAGMLQAWLEPPRRPPPPAWLPATAPLRVDAGDPPLDPAAIGRLTGELCAFNRGRFGVLLQPLTTRPYGEVVAAAVAAAPQPACRGGVFLGGPAERTGAARTLAELRAALRPGADE